MSLERQKPLETGFGRKPEPEEIMAGVDLTGRTVVITGGYSGIGLETTRALVGAGARVIAPSRRPEAAQDAFAEIDGDITVAAMDLGDLASVRRAASDIADANDEIHLLINNAGIMACPETRIGPGWEAQFATNHLGHAVLFDGLKGALRQGAEKNDGVRVVALSSIAHLRSDILWDDFHFQSTPYEKWTAYAQSKTANALFALGVDAQFTDDGVRAFSVHPGGILTPLQRHLEKQEMMALGWIDENGEIPEKAQSFFKTPPQGAATTLWAATSPMLNGLGGVYCEDCNIAAPQTSTERAFNGVRPYAVDEAGAERLWAETAKVIDAVS